MKRTMRVVAMASVLLLSGCGQWQAPALEREHVAHVGEVGLVPASLLAVLDAAARTEAAGAVAVALDTGRAMPWEDENAGGTGPARGLVSVSVEHAEVPCRAYLHSVLVGGRPMEVQGLACRNAAGGWMDAWPGRRAGEPAWPGSWPGCYAVDNGGWWAVAGRRLPGSVRC